ncbi:hypothetical protein ABT040_17085 [Streptomyces sp. NPDC002688]|uniref:hypothetical protein n=1 Tax=Streptomyces sp. NPDC002688 TaxID=3154423 RepID=UPI00332ABD1C
MSTWVRALATAALVATSVLLPATPAAADDNCPGSWDVEIGTKYPVSLHAVTVWLCHDRGFTNAYARAWVPNDGASWILSVDRHRKEVSGKEFWTTAEIENVGGGWDYWEDSGVYWLETSEHDNYKNAMRVCLRRNGDLKCAGWWFADQDL